MAPTFPDSYFLCNQLQANAIYLELERMGFKVWYDNRADDLTKEGMLKGIEQAAAFVLFLSQGERDPHTAPPTGQVHTIADANPSFCALLTRPQKGSSSVRTARWRSGMQWRSRSPWCCSTVSERDTR